MENFRSKSEGPFELFKNLYKTDNIFSGNFWFAGNALHAGLNYFLATQQQDKDGFLRTAYNIYQPMSTGTGWWADDYSWWGNAFMLAINNRDKLGYGGSSNDAFFNDLLTSSQDCWSKLNDNWEDEPYNIPPTYDYAYGNSKDICGGTCNFKGSDTMEGRNSVTNESFLMLSNSLCEYYKKSQLQQSQYINRAWNLKNWFDQWLRLPQDVNGIRGIRDKDGFILERPTGNEADKYWFWTGDQGLFMTAYGSDAMAKEIAKRVIENTSLLVDPDGVLHENLGFTQNENLKQFEGDYATGKGIFMRNLSLLNSVAPDKSYKDFIQNNANAIIGNLKNGQISYNWNYDKYGHPPYEPRYLNSGKPGGLDNLIMQACGLDALSAAIRLFG